MTQYTDPITLNTHLGEIKFVCELDTKPFTALRETDLISGTFIVDTHPDALLGACKKELRKVMEPYIGKSFKFFVDTCMPYTSSYIKKYNDVMLRDNPFAQICEPKSSPVNNKGCHHCRYYADEATDCLQESYRGQYMRDGLIGRCSLFTEDLPKVKSPVRMTHYDCGVKNCGGGKCVHQVTDEDCPHCGKPMILVTHSGFKFCSAYARIGGCDYEVNPK